MLIHVEVAGRRVTSVSVSQETTEVTIKVPPPANGGAKKQEGPLIVLTDK